MKMRTDDALSTSRDHIDWPQEPSGILIMGKRQGTKKENKQLWGRVAMAAALWYSAPQPKPYLLFVAYDGHDSRHISDAGLVKSLLIEKFGIPGDFIILREKTNCTLLEVRAVRVLSRVYGLSNIFAVTHLYHAPRAQRYMNEILPQASVIPVHLDVLDEIAFPEEADDLLNEIQTLIADSLPTRLDLIREHGIEWLLNQAHTLDSQGRIERRLAKILRPRAYQ